MTSAMVQDSERVNCPICGEDRTTPYIRSAGPWQIVRCTRDGLVYVNPRAPANVIRAQAEAFVRGDNEYLFDFNRDPTLRREAKEVMALKQGGALLDVGCATGRLFAHFPAPWRLFGVDPCLSAVERVRERYSAEVRCGSIKDTGWQPGFFDVITILDALYYFPNPLEELIAARQILKPDGILVVEIPNIAYKLWRERGPLCWALDRKWSRLTPESLHLYHYSPHSLALLLEKAGFQILRFFPEQAPMGSSRFLNALNDMHFGVAKSLFRFTGGSLSIAAKDLYVCVVAPSISRETARRLPAPVTAAPVVSELKPVEVARAVELHMAHLTERFSGEPGRRLLTQYYELLCTGAYGLCLTHRPHADGEIDGMVVLRWGGAKITRRLWRQRPVGNTWLVARQAMRQPGSAWPLIRALWERRPLSTLQHMAGRPHPWCILHALVTDPGGRGTGRALVEAALGESRQRGFKYMATTTYQSIGAATHLYESAGFTPMLTTREGNRHINWYGQAL